MNIRPAKATDISAVTQVFSAALANLFQRHGLADQVTQPMPPNPYYTFSIDKEPGILGS